MSQCRLSQLTSEVRRVARPVAERAPEAVRCHRTALRVFNCTGELHAAARSTRYPAWKDNATRSHLGFHHLWPIGQGSLWPLARRTHDHFARGGLGAASSLLDLSLSSTMPSAPVILVVGSSP